MPAPAHTTGPDREPVRPVRAGAAGPDGDAVRPAQPAQPVHPAQPARHLPVRRLTVLYDDRCALCAFVRGWLGRQRQLVPLAFVPAGSAQARRLYPALDHTATLEEITVVGDGGQVYLGPAAWIVCLWALREHRPLAHRLSTPSGARLARGAVLAAAKWRKAGQDRSWGGNGHARQEGWVYERGTGWTYRPDGRARDTCRTD